MSTPAVTGVGEAAVLLKEKGNLAFKSGHFETAVEHYSSAIAMDATVAAFFSNRAAAWLALGSFEEAIQDCDSALQLDPKFAKAYVRAGQAHLRLVCVCQPPRPAPGCY